MGTTDRPPSGRASLGTVRVRLRNPDREIEVAGPRRVRDVLADLGIDPDTVLVIRERTLVTREERLDDADEIEVRPVISGGGGEGTE
jgi:sulfur carrier protein ThiS